jgi:hypothetical protein
VKITGIMQKSNEVARSMAQLMKVGQFQSVSAQFSKELIKVELSSRPKNAARLSYDMFQMGIMGEMMNEAVDAAMDNNDLEEETDEEVAKVLDEVLAGRTSIARERDIEAWHILFVSGKVGQLPSVAIGATTVRERETAGAAAANEDSEEDDMERRLQALRS